MKNYSNTDVAFAAATAASAAAFAFTTVFKEVSAVPTAAAAPCYSLETFSARVSLW